MTVSIRPAGAPDAPVISCILHEAARWLVQSGMPMWRANELDPARITADAGAGLLFLAEYSGEAAGTIKFQLADELFWPDLSDDTAAYVHRLAVRRRFAGQGVATALLSWAVKHAAALDRSYVRLDCEASRPRLRAVYEKFGFRHHSDRQVGPYFVSRYQYEVKSVSDGAKFCA